MPQPFRLTVEETAGLYLFTFVGRLDTLTAEEAAVVINQVIAQGAQVLLFDLSQLDYMNTAGMRLLLSVRRQIIEKQGRLAFFALHPTVEEVIRMAGFMSIFEVFEDYEQAVKWVRS